MRRLQQYNHPYFFGCWSQEKALESNVGAASIARGDERRDDIVDDTMMTPMTIATIVIMAAVAANLNAKDATIRKKVTAWQRANAGSAARAMSVDQRRQKIRERNATSVNTRKRSVATIASNGCATTSSDEESRNNDKKTVASGEEKRKDDNKHDNFAMVMAPPAKKAKTTRCVVPRKPRKVVESDDNLDAFFAETASLLSDRVTLWPSDGLR
jgi:hypothetical protein